MSKNIMNVSTRLMGTCLLVLLCSTAARAQQFFNPEDWAINQGPRSIAPTRVKINDATVRLYGILDARSPLELLAGDSQVFKILADGTFVPIGPVQPSNDIEAMDISPLTGQMYGITSSGPLAGNLYRIDKSTGALTLIGNTGLTEVISGSFHPTTGEFWVYKHLSGLYTIDLDTAAATFKYTPVGTGVFKTWEGLAWDNTGTYLYGQNRDRLYRWNPATLATEVLCTGLQAGEGLDFSPEGTLYGGLDAQDPADLRLFTLDANSCAQVPSGLAMPAGDIEGIAFETKIVECTGHIGDFVWSDLDADGVQDPGEPGIGGVGVTLLTSGGAIVGSTTTDPSGLYGFSRLCAGDYRVEIDATTLPPSFVPSPCNVPPDDNTDNDCSPADVTLPTDSSSDITKDFGYHCECTDTDACTVDSCDPVLGCVHAPVACDDGNACNIDACDPASGCTHTVRDCNDHDKCTNDRCDPATGCVNSPINCDDGNACTTNTCDPASGCVSTTIDCNDHDKCTNDSCDPATGCVHVAVECDDGNACNVDACDSASGCTHTVLDCNDHDICTNDRCNPATGCVNDPVTCDDGNACTTDSCDPASGCSYAPRDCSDGDRCTTDTCSPSSGCAHEPRNCDDGVSCTTDACDPATGTCSHSDGDGPSCSVMGEPDLCGGETATYSTDAVGATLTYEWTITAGPCTIIGSDTGPSVQVRGNTIGNCTVSVKVTDSASGCEGTCSQGVCVHGQSSGCNPVGQCLVPYPYTSANARTSIDFNESEVLRAFTVSTVNGCLPDQIRIFYNDEHALTLGVRRVIVKTSNSTTTTDYPITPLLTNPGSAIDPQVGSTVSTGDQAGTDLAGRPLYPSLFITDITNDPSDMSGDWQFGGTPIPPHAIFGTWKGAVRTVDKRRTPAKVTVQPDADPAKNHWSLGGGDAVPPGLHDEGYGAEARWDVSRLGLVEGHTYRVYFMVHDGDQNKTGGDVGHDCANLLTQTQPTCTEAQQPLCDLGYPFPSTNPRTNVIFNESEVLRAFGPGVAGPGDTIKVWYNDEKALTLGVRRVSIKTSSGTTSTDYPVTPLGSVPGSSTNPQVGTTDLTGDQAGTDQSARPMWPALFLTDVTSNLDSRACDWQSGPSFPAECTGHTAIPPHAVFGTWKGAVRLVDKTHTPAVVTVTPDADPSHNNWALGGGDPAPAGATNQGFGAEARWSVDSLVAAGIIIPGHAYRVQFMVHDGDQNKNGGDTGQNCAIVSIGTPSPCGATILVTPPASWYPMTPAAGPPVLTHD